MQEYVMRGEHIFDHPMGVVPHKSNSIKDYEDLYDLNISVNQVLTEKGQFMDDNNLSVELDDTYEVGLRKVQRGRLDAVAGAIPTILFLVKELSYEKFFGKPLVIRMEPIYFQCSKKSNYQEYFYRINNAIKKMKNEGVLKKIIISYS